MGDSNAAHVRLVARFIREGTVVPFLGAGVNMCGRTEGEGFVPGQRLPSGAELAGYLAEYFGYPAAPDDLVRVSQFAEVMAGSGGLYEALRDVFNADYPPTQLHRLLADIPGLLRARGVEEPQIIVTTNYDDALERAFADAGEPFDLAYYIAEGPDRGRFLHIPPEGEPCVIDRPNEYDRFQPESRTVIAKIHGAVDRADPDGDSFVITEDDYIDYLAHTDIGDLIPVQLASRLRRSHFLFLGYSLRDWNLRVILHRIWGSQKLRYNSWAVQLAPDPLEKKSWSKRDVELIEAQLEEYVDELRAAIAEGADREVPV